MTFENARNETFNYLYFVERLVVSTVENWYVTPIIIPKDGRTSTTNT